MIVISIIKGTYIETTDDTLKELLPFRNFLKYGCYKAMKHLHVFMKQLILISLKTQKKLQEHLRTMQQKLHQII